MDATKRNDVDKVKDILEKEEVRKVWVLTETSLAHHDTSSPYKTLRDDLIEAITVQSFQKYLRFQIKLILEEARYQPEIKKVFPADMDINPTIDAWYSQNDPRAVQKIQEALTGLVNNLHWKPTGHQFHSVDAKEIVNFLGQDGKTPLHNAVIYNTNCVSFLLAR